MPSTSDPIAVRGLTMAFGERVVMHDLTFEVGRGDIFFIMGPSGSGKSVLMRHLLGLLDPAAGEIFYEGERFTGAASADRARMLRRCGVTFQTGGLWSSLTLAENVAVPLEVRGLHPREVARKVAVALRGVGLDLKGGRFPLSLSGGEQQRAAVARALVGDPALLLADEPTGNLDADRTLEVMALLEAASARGTTVVVATHDRALLARHKKRVIALEAGRMVSDGDSIRRAAGS